MKTTPAIIDELRQHAQATYPEECCGILLGRYAPDGNEILATVPVENDDDNHRERRYSIAPRDYLRAEKQARDRNLDIVGVYHSHPDHPARPSETDLQEATFPRLTYVIVGVDRGEPEEPTAWTLAADRSRFDAEPIHQTKHTT